MVRRYPEGRCTDPNVDAALLSAEVVAHRAHGNVTRNATEAQEADRAIGAGFPDVRVTVTGTDDDRHPHVVPTHEGPE